MARVFLDTNIFIDAVHRAPEKHTLAQLLGHLPYVSTLSFHIYCYTFKIKVPNSNLPVQRESFQLVDYTSRLLEEALHGPTTDLEDNIQLHSAVKAECDYFLTRDKKLLKMKYFGSMRIVAEISPQK